jgi:hypothetical protein
LASTSSRNRGIRSGAEFLAAYGVAAVLLACLSVRLGKDANWDLQNYHAYAPWALLHGGFTRDVLAGNWQAYLNPTVHLVRHALTAFLRPVSAAAALAAIQALNVAILYLITSRVLAREGAERRTALSALAAALGMLSAVFLSQIGTSFSDILLSIPTLGALCLLVPAGGSEDPEPDVRRFAIAGGMMGLALGLKLTNHSLTIAFGIAAGVGWSSWRHRLRTVVITGLAGAVGTAVTALPWAIRMYREFGHPLFPLLGPGETILEGARDLRFRPAGVLDAFTYPWKWAAGIGVTSEIPFTDVRPILLLALLVLASCAAPFRRSRPTAPDASVGERRVAVFLVVGTVLWLLSSGLHRHAMPLDLLVGPALVLCCRRAMPGRAGIVAATLLAVAALVTVRPPDWGRRPWTRTWFDVQLPPALRMPATYVLLPRSGAPLGFLAPSFPDGSVFVQSDFAAFVPPGSVLDRRARRIFADAKPDRTFLLVDAPPDDVAQSAMRELGFDLAVPCRRIRTALRPVAACPLFRAATAHDDATVLRLGAWFTPGSPGDGTLILGDGWAEAEPWGRWAVGPRSTLRFRALEPVAGRSVLEFVGYAFVATGLPPLEVGVYADGRHAGNWTFAGDADRAETRRTICLPSSWTGGPLTVELRPDSPRSPASLERGPDPRPLSIGLRRLRIRPAAAGECST